MRPGNGIWIGLSGDWRITKVDKNVRDTTSHFGSSTNSGARYGCGDDEIDFVTRAIAMSYERTIRKF